MKKVYERPLLKDHKLQQHNYLLAAVSQPPEDAQVDRKIYDDDDEVDFSF